MIKTGAAAATAAQMAVVPRARTRRRAGDAWLERTNPLTRLGIRAAQNVYDSARGGAYTRIQYIYGEMERTDPTLMTCVERRLSALSSLGWRVVADDDSPEAAAQKERLERLCSQSANLSDAIEHLGLAFFRGFSFASPYMNGDGRLAFSLPPSWEFNRSPDGTWWHNPDLIEGAPGGCGQRAFNPADVLHIERPRAVDYPALALFLRHDVAEDQWGRFLERYGIPPVILTMPPLTSQQDADRFAAAAQSVYDALCGAVPNGTTVNTLAEARGTDPFSAFVEHQEKTIVRLCTGGTLGSIAESGSGTLAGNAQEDVWRDIVGRDAVKISEEFTRWFGRHLFPGGMRVRFELGTERRSTPDEVFETAAKARQAGYRFTQEYLEAETGAELSEEPSTAPGNAPGDPFSGGAGAPCGAASFKTAFNAFKTPSTDLGGQSDGFGAKGRKGRFRASDAGDANAAMDSIAATLEQAMLDAAVKAIEKDFGGEETDGEDGEETDGEDGEDGEETERNHRRRA